MEKICLQAKARPNSTSVNKQQKKKTNPGGIYPWKPLISIGKLPLEHDMSKGRQESLQNRRKEEISNTNDTWRKSRIDHPATLVGNQDLIEPQCKILFLSHQIKNFQILSEIKDSSMIH